MATTDNDHTDDPSNKEENIKENIIELEAQLKALQVKNDFHEGFMQYSGREKWRTIFFIFPLIILSLLPPLFVVFDRWFQVSQVVNFSRDTWCKIDFLCQAHLPSYFLWIFYILGLISILMIVFAPSFYGNIEKFLHEPEIHNKPDSVQKGQSDLRKQLILLAIAGLVMDLIICFTFHRVPGMELLLVVIAFLAAIYVGEKEFTSQMFTSWVDDHKGNISLYATMVFSQIALILFLREVTSFNTQKWIYYILMLFALAAIIIQRKKLPKIFWIFSLAVIVFTFQMNSWKFSQIGDEYSFFFYPVQVISHQSFFQMVDEFFKVNGVYDIVPYFSSFITYLFMIFAGFDHFGWQLSISLLMALMVPMVYDFLKTFIHERLAFLAVIPLAFSHYLINFSKVGYTNLQAVFMMCFILWVASKAIKGRTFSLYFLLGISLGVCFYTYPLALYTIPLVALLLFLFDSPRSKATLLRYSFTIFGLVLMLIPIFFQPVYWSNMAGRTVFFINNGSLVTNSAMKDIINRFASNLLYIPFVYLFIPGEGVYVVSSLVDPLLAVFIPLGFLLAIINLRRSRFIVFLTISYLFELLIISVSNPYDAPPLTRMFLFIPFYFIFAMLGVDWVARVLAGITNRPRKFYYFAITGVLIAAGLVNLIQSTFIYDERTPSYTLEPTVLRLFQHDAIKSPGDAKVYLFLTDKDSSLFWYDTFQEVYGVPDSEAQLQRLIVDSPQISDYWLQQMKDQDNLVIIVPYSFPAPLLTSLQPILKQSGKTECDVSDLPGKNLRYQMWYSSQYPDLCSEAQSIY
jgi:hypothetical protein